jgi:secondary thiamine-phosphate synthase enzyme
MHDFTVRTQRHTEFVNIDRQVQETVRQSGVRDGVAQVFVPHTTAGITINENADPDVTADIQMVLDRMVPWQAGYAHNEGNTAAHVKASLMGFSTAVLVKDGALQLGTWQSIYFCEFDGPRSRKVWVQVTGK